MYRWSVAKTFACTRPYRCWSVPVPKINARRRNKGRQRLARGAVAIHSDGGGGGGSGGGEWWSEWLRYMGVENADFSERRVTGRKYEKGRT